MSCEKPCRDYRAASTTWPPYVESRGRPDRGGSRGTDSGFPQGGYPPRAGALSDGVPQDGEERPDGARHVFRPSILREPVVRRGAAVLRTSGSERAHHRLRRGAAAVASATPFPGTRPKTCP